jgi:hypothetical protein
MRTPRGNRAAILSLVTAAAVAVPSIAHAQVLVQGDLIADNWAMVLTGPANGTPLSPIVPPGVVGGPNAPPQVYSFTTSDDYLYIVAWSDDYSQQGLLHDLSANGLTLWSSDASLYLDTWDVYATGDDLDTGTGPSVPDVSAIEAQIIIANAGTGGAGTSGTWVDPAVGGINDGLFPPGNPWIWPEVLANIATEAHWIWYDSGNDDPNTAGGGPVPFRPGFDHDEYLIFRTCLSCTEVTINGSLAVDNWAMLLTGDPNGDTLTPAGGVVGGPNLVHSYSFNTQDEVLYIVAWSDEVAQQGLLHDLSADGFPLWSDAAFFYPIVWEVYATGDDRDTGTGPSVLAIQDQIAIANLGLGGPGTSGTWVDPAVGGINDGTFPPGNPWSPPGPIAMQAHWIWHDSGNQTSVNAPFQPWFEHDEYLIFRTRAGVLRRTAGGGAADCDGDGVPDYIDNCPSIYNPSQAQAGMGSGRGLLCDTTTDFDGDGVPEADDNCPTEGLEEDPYGGTRPFENCNSADGFADCYNPGQEDLDGDGIGDLCCPRPCLKPCAPTITHQRNRRARHVFCISGTSNGVGWSYGFTPPPLPAQVNLPPLPVGAPASDFAAEFVKSINDLSPSFGLDAKQLMTKPECFTVRLQPGFLTPFGFQVGPFGSPPTCSVPLNPSACTFNPTIFDAPGVDEEIPALSRTGLALLLLTLLATGTALVIRRRGRQERSQSP